MDVTCHYFCNFMVYTLHALAQSAAAEPQEAAQAQLGMKKKRQLSLQVQGHREDRHFFGRPLDPLFFLAK